MTDWYDIRQRARRDIHTAFAVEARYTDFTKSVSTTLHVRWQQRFGSPVGSITRDLSGVYETIDRIIFDTVELADKKITPRRGGELYFPKYDQTVRLGTQEPASGPIEQAWAVST